MGVRTRLPRAHRAVMALVLGWLIVGLLATKPVAVAASDIATFRVSQAVAKLPNIAVYLEMLKAEGDLRPDVKLENLTAAVGAKPATVKSIQSFADSREGVAFIFLVDISKSLKEKQFKEMRRVLDTWIDAMADKDQAAIMTFGTDVTEIQNFTDNRVSLKGKIAELKPSDQQTQLHLGLIKAIELGHRLDPDVPTRKAILILSDGQDDYAGGLTKQVVLDKIRIDTVPIYAIGFSNLTGAEKDKFLKQLGEFAVTSGGAFVRADAAQFEQAFDKLRRHIIGVYVVKLACESCQGDGGVHRLQVNFMDGPQRMTDGLDIRLLASPAPATTASVNPEPEKSTEPVKPSEPVSPPKTIWDYWWLMIIGVAILGGLAWYFWPKEEIIAEPEEVVQQPPLPEGVKLRLTQIRGDLLDQPIETTLYESLVIGRDNSCGIVLPDDKRISRKHCELIRRGDEVFLRDLGSKNGTLVNGVPINGTIKVQDDDTIALGSIEFRLSIIGGGTG